MNVNDELEKFRQRKAQEFFTQELPNRLKGFKAALEGTPEEIKKKLDDQEEMDYKKEIIEMIGKIENTCWLRSIYVFIRTLTTR